jgi:hypothetical protein
MVLIPEPKFSCSRRQAGTGTRDQTHPAKTSASSQKIRLVKTTRPHVQGGPRKQNHREPILAGQVET